MDQPWRRKPSYRLIFTSIRIREITHHFLNILYMYTVVAIMLLESGLIESYRVGSLVYKHPHYVEENDLLKFGDDYRAAGM